MINNKVILVDSEIHKKLSFLKLDKGLKKLSDVIKGLINESKSK